MNLPEPRGPFAATCPTRELLDQLADKWSVLVLVALDTGPARFSALKRALEGVSQKVLTQTLRRLARNGLIDRDARPTVPVTVTYSLTPLGHSLAGVVEELRRWSVNNVAAVIGARSDFDAG